MVYLIMSEYRLDRTVFKAGTVAEAAGQVHFYKKISWRERVKIAAYLNSVAYDFAENRPLKMDKTKFKARSR